MSELELRWEKLSQRLQDHYVTLLWKDGFTEKAIADFLSTTKGRIVRHRQTRLKLPTGGRPTIKSEVERDRFLDLLALSKMDDMAEEGVIPIAPPEESTPARRPKPRPPKKKKPVLRLVPKPAPIPAPVLPPEVPAPAPVVEPEPLPLPEPTQAPQLPAQELCGWPVATATGSRVCGKPVVPGHRMCQEHIDKIPRRPL